MTGTTGRWILATVDRDQAIDALPAPYGDVIRLLDGGASAVRVAEQLAVDPDAAATLVAVAEGKLAELQAQPADLVLRSER